MGCFFDAEAFSIGREMLTSIGDLPGEWYVKFMIELAMGDHRLAILNPDLRYDFDTSSNTPVWVGAHPGFPIVDRDRAADDTDADPALGLGGKHGSYRPFFQRKGTLSDNSDSSESALAVGIRF